VASDLPQQEERDVSSQGRITRAYSIFRNLSVFRSRRHSMEHPCEGSYCPVPAMHNND
jgi:hypothetical protein